MWREEAEIGRSSLPQNLSKWVFLSSASLNLSRALGESLSDNFRVPNLATPTVGSQHPDFSFLMGEYPGFTGRS